MHLRKVSLSGIFICASIILIAFVCSLILPTPIRSVEYYKAKFDDPSFRWSGPVSRKDRIPTSHAARALAYIGDEGVETLFWALENTRVKPASIYDALEEIGLPVDMYEQDIILHRDPTNIRKWWIENRVESRSKRSNYRIRCGLPALR